MKKLVLGSSLTFAALILLTSPALAETKADTKPRQEARTPSAADRAFLAALARMPIAPAAAAKKPEEPPIGETALCTAVASCGDGTYVSCEGNNSTTSCSAADRNCPEKGHVTCDGVTTWCPQHCCAPYWCSGPEICLTGCECGYISYGCNEANCSEWCNCRKCW